VAVIFVETPVFKRLIANYLDEEGLRRLQNELLLNPQTGSLIRKTKGLRKMRFADPSRNKGKRGGLKIIYYRS